MNTKTKKRILIAVAVLLLLAVLAAGGGALYLRSLPSPLAEYDFTDCTVELYAKWADATYMEMTEIDTEIFRMCLQSAWVSPLARRNAPDYLIGARLHPFCVRFSNGSTLDVGFSEEYLVIGGRWYRCDETTLDVLRWLKSAYNTQYYDQYAAPANTFT